MRKLLGELIGVAITLFELAVLVRIRHRVIQLHKSVILAEVYAEQIRQRSNRDASSN